MIRISGIGRMENSGYLKLWHEDKLFMPNSSDDQRLVGPSEMSCVTTVGLELFVMRPVKFTYPPWWPKIGLLNTGFGSIFCFVPEDSRIQFSNFSSVQTPEIR